MLKEQSSFKIIDLLLTGLALGAAYVVNLQHSSTAELLASDYEPAFLLLATLVCSGLSYDFFGLYERHGRQSFDHVLLLVAKSVLAASASVVLLLYLLSKAEGSQFLMLFFTGFAIFFLAGYRAIVQRRRKKGVNGKEILVIGCRERARELIRYVVANKELGYHLIGCLDVEVESVESEVAEGIKVIGTMDDFQRILLYRAVDEIIFALPLERVEKVVDYIAFAEEQGVKVRILPDWQLPELMYQPTVGSVYIETFVGIPTMSLSSGPRKRLSLLIKATLDRTLSLAAVLLLLPIFVSIGIAIKLDSRGPVLFRQKRSGLNGRTFTMYKFRTMVLDAEALRTELETENEMDGPVFKIEHDPRITPVGRFLRRTSLDELPQLINVLKGEMSLVGPRPPIPEEVKEYQHWQRRRLSMKPGLTCIWQVSGRNKIGFEEWMRMDLEYIDKWSLLLDFKLLLKTVPAILIGTGE